jgi:nucleoside-diphosphate-sugar epimerase
VELMTAIKLVEKALDKPAKLVHEPSRPADVPATWADIGKAQRLLGWRPHTDIEAGTARLVEWYLQNQGWARQIAV